MSEKILLVDDNAELRDLFRELLEGSGYEVLEAENGETGLSLWQRNAADLLVLDLMMPDKDGFAVLHELKREGKKPKVLVISGALKGGKTWLEPLDQHLPDIRYLEKPFTNERFLTVVEEMLAH